MCFPDVSDVSFFLYFLECHHVHIYKRKRKHTNLYILYILHTCICILSKEMFMLSSCLIFSHFSGHFS